jgi:hypothetical protein
MTDTPQSSNQMDRIAALEAGLAHLRELVAWRHETTSQRISELIAHNRFQDTEAEKLATKLGREIEKIEETLWSGLKWLGAALITTLLSVVLKALGLV